MAQIQGYGCELFRVRTVREHTFRETDSKVYELQRVQIHDKIPGNWSLVLTRQVNQSSPDAEG